MINVKWIVVGVVVWLGLMAGVRAMEHTQCQHTVSDQGKNSTEIAAICK